jgi:hypothetical protein
MTIDILKNESQPMFDGFGFSRTILLLNFQPRKLEPLLNPYKYSWDSKS